jgi:hypothetical protein
METHPLLFHTVGSVCLLDFYRGASPITHGTTVLRYPPTRKWGHGCFPPPVLNLQATWSAGIQFLTVPIGLAQTRSVGRMGMTISESLAGLAPTRSMHRLEVRTLSQFGLIRIGVVVAL